MPLAFSSYGQDKVVVSETLGQVGDYVVTSREVRISKLIESIIFPPAKKESINLKDLAFSKSDAVLPSALASVLLENVVAFEARAFNLGEASEEDIHAAVEKVEAASEVKSLTKKWELDSEELKKLIKRKIVAKNFLKFKTNSMVGIVTDAEVKSYYDGNRAKFSDDSFEAYRENIRVYLTQQQLEERLRAWFEVVQRKYKVRNFLADKPL